MEGLREIATAYYQRSADREKEAAKAFFRRVDADGDGRVTLGDLRRSSLSPRVSNENVFRQLDRNRDGVLDFSDALPVYYIVNKMDLVTCCGCGTLLSGPYFSCCLCLGKGDDSFNLCCGCYSRGDVIVHEHSLQYLVDHHSLLAELRRRSAVDDTNRRKKEMDELGEIAIAHYQAGSAQVQKLAYDFFVSIDTNGDSQVELSEFLDFLKLQGYSEMGNLDFFRELDQDRNGTLDFFEVMTLYYIIKSGRPFCNACNHFIPGTFFSCVECFKAPDKASSFNLCHNCYCSANCSHNHGGRTQFLDNYTLLETTRNQGLAQATGVASSSERSPIPANTAMVPVMLQQPQTHAYANSPYSTPCNHVYPSAHPHPNYPIAHANTHTPYSTPYNHVYAAHPSAALVPNHMNAVVLANTSSKWDKCRLALNVFEMALSVGNIAGTMCTIL